MDDGRLTSHRCSKCHTTCSWAAFFDQSALGYPELGVLVHTCPLCATRDEFQARPGRVGLGYVYAAGAAHFAVEKELDVSGLGVAGGNQGAIEVEYEGRTWSFPAPTG